MKRPTTITLLAMWALATLAAGAGAVAVEQAGSDSDVPAVVAPTRATTAPAPDDPGSGEVQFRGGVGSLELIGDFDPDVLFGATFVAEGNGSSDGAEIEGVLVGDELATIVWDGGRPLMISGAGSFSFDRAPITLAGGTLRADVGAHAAQLGPGTYQVDAPVAVGRAGLAEPRDAVEFVAGATEVPTVQFRGRVVLELPSVPIDVSGPGGLVLEGTFTSSDEDGTEQEIERIVVDETDAYTISLAPLAGGWIVDGRAAAGAVVD